MALPVDPLLRVDPLPQSVGIVSISAVLADGVSAAGFEGAWVPWGWVKAGAVIEVTSVGTFTGSAQLYGTNALNPQNGSTVTIGGSIAGGTDIVNLTLTFAGLAPIVTSYTTLGGDTTATLVATGLTAALQANVSLRQLGVTAANVGAAITINWPSPLNSVTQGSFASLSTPAPLPFLTIAGANSPGSETYTIAPLTTGSTMGSAISATGLTAISSQARWIKLRIPTLSSGVITAIAQGTA